VSALDGIRILDLSSGIAGPLGVLLLAEHGADVIKVEPRSGDPFRDYPGYRVWNRSRRSVVVPDEEHLRALVRTADAIVLTGWGIEPEAALAVNPACVVVSCPGYPTGHRQSRRAGNGWDVLIQAASGQMYEQPGWRDGPIFLRLPMPSMGALYLVTTGVLAGLAARARTGRGQVVETSLLQGALLYTTMLWQDVPDVPPAYHSSVAKTYPPGVHQLMMFECAAGEYLHWSIMSGVTPSASLEEVAGLPASADRRAHLRGLDRDRLVDALRAANHAVEPVVAPGAILRHPQTIANGTVADVAGTTQMGVPLHLLGTPGEVVGPEPEVGAHTEEVLATLGARVPAAVGSGSGERGSPPLAGVRVLDFGQYLAGPFGPMILGDLGADVVKIEPPRGDAMRMTPKPFAGCQRGKRSLALDLKDARGLEVAMRLVAGADVVHHNMTRGVATRLGIDYEACRAVRPDVIYCNTYAYGLPDPFGGFGGLDPLYQASAGIEHEAGPVSAGNPPLYVRFGMCDTSNAMLSAVGVLLALVLRQRTGEGQELWTSLHDGGMVFTSDVWLDRNGQPWPGRPELDGGQQGLAPGYRIYRCQDGAWLAVAAVRDKTWAALVAATGASESGALEAAFASRPALAWSRELDAAGVPNELVVDTFEGRTVLHDDDNVRLGLVASYEHPEFGPMRQFGALWSFSDTPVRIGGPPPVVGQHSRDVLHEAGLPDGDIDQLIAAGVVVEPPAR
jgi:crotonobetainyl-CoA:carnitine CoA-transferase CaiB-like acyl-CoA transferase